MIKYKFYRNEINYPQFGVEDEILGDFGGFSLDELKDIVDNLEGVKLGIKNDCLFGGEISDINCRRKAEDEEYIPGKITCVIHYGFGKDNKRINIDFEDIYNLMKDWKDYIEEWEKETGLKKISRFN